MSDTLGKTKLISKIAARADGISKEKCETVIDLYMDEVIKALAAGDKVVIKNFMTFEVIERAEREGRDLKTGEIVTYPPVKLVKCKVSKVLKDAVNEK